MKYSCHKIDKNTVIIQVSLNQSGDFGRSSSFLALSRPYFINHFLVWRPGPTFLNSHQKPQEVEAEVLFLQVVGSADWKGQISEQAKGGQPGD